VKSWNEPLGVAIVGSGYWGINYVRIFSELPQARPVVVCDAREERLEEVSRRFPHIRVTTKIDDALATEGVDAAVVCTPATTHHTIATRCLEADKPILIEKPITRTSDQAENLIALAESKGLILMVGHTFVYNPAIRKMKEYIQNDELGRLYFLYSRRTNMGPIRQDVNALWDLAPHDISIFNYLLDASPEWVSAVGARVLRNGREDVGFVSLGYPSNIVAHIQVSWADAYKVREVVVVGSDKRIAFNELNPLERVRIFEKGVSPVESEAANYGEYNLRIRDGDIISPPVETSEPLKNECIHFVDCVTQRVQPLTDGWAGLDVVRVMEAIDRSVAQRGAPVELVKENQRVYEARYGSSLRGSESTIPVYVGRDQHRNIDSHL
jgi:predicted dehydrogenase